MAVKTKGKLVVEMTGEELKLLRSMQKVIGETVKMEAGFGKAKKSAKKMGDSGTKSMTDLKSAMAGVAVAGGAIALAMRDAESTAKEAATALDLVGGNLLDKIAISENLKQFKELTSLDERLQSRFGFSRLDAGKFSFALRSQGVSLEGVEELGALRLVEKNPLALNLGAVKLKKQFPKLLADQSLFDVAGKLFVAAAKSPVAAGALAELALEPLAVGKPLGFKPSDVLAAVSLGAGAAATAEKGRTNIKGIFSALGKDANVDLFSGTGLFESIELIREMSAKDRRRTLGGSQEALLGYDLIVSQLDEMRELAREIKATGGAEVVSKQNLALKVPEIQALQGAQIAAQKLEIAQAPFALREKMQDTLFDTARRIAIEQGDPGIFSSIDRDLLEVVIAKHDLFNPPITTTAIQLGRQLLTPEGGGGPTRELLESIRLQLEVDVEGPGKKRHEEQRDIMNETLRRIEENTRLGGLFGGGFTPVGLVPVGADE